MVKDDFTRAKDLYKWNRYALDILGVWPLKPSYAKFTVWMVYLSIHMIMEFADLYQVLGNLELMVLNLSESALAVMIFVKMMVVRCSSLLKKIMIQINVEIDERLFNDAEEKEIYLRYNRIAKWYFKLWSTMAVAANMVYYMKPLEFRLRSVLGNESMPFVVAYRERFFFDVNDSLRFWLVWIYQSPMMCVHIFHTVSIGYFLSIVLHVCGNLSVLAYRIKSLDAGVRENSEKARYIFRDIVETHCNILRTARNIESVISVLLLVELFISSLLVGLAAYVGLVNADSNDPAAFISFIVYAGTMLFLLYGYCLAGEYLITESTNVYEAYYQCKWFDLSNSVKRQLMICMIGSTKPIQLTGGGYYVFSSAGFTNVLKTIMGYISMLRTII